MTSTGPAGALMDPERPHRGPERGSDPNGDDGDGPRVRRRRRLPGSRAVVGSLLIALSALGVLVAYTDATAGPTTRYVVAARDIPSGHRLEATDLRTVAMTLPEEVSGRAFTDPGSLVGATAVASLGRGELVQVGGLVRQGGQPGSRQLSFPVEADLAVSGDLEAGEEIDVVATFGSGPDARTESVVTAVPVVGVTDAGAALGGRFVVITVALHDDADVLALSHAIRSGKVVVVRSTGATPWSDPEPRSSRTGDRGEASS